MTACSMHIKTTRVTSQSYWLPSSPLSQFVTNLVTLFRPLGCDVIYGRSYMSGEQGITEWCWQVILIIACCHSGRLAHLLLEHFDRNTKNTLLVFRMTNTWKSPEMNIYLDFDLKLATFQYIDGFGFHHFCLTRIGLELDLKTLNPFTSESSDAWATSTKMMWFFRFVLRSFSETKVKVFPKPIFLKRKSFHLGNICKFKVFANRKWKLGSIVGQKELHQLESLLIQQYQPDLNVDVHPFPCCFWTHNQCWEFATGSPQNRKSATAEQTFSLRICDTQI